MANRRVPGSAFHFTAEFETGTKLALPVELPSFEGLEVLVVDDNRTNRFFLAELLSRWGMKPVCVDTGKAR